MEYLAVIGKIVLNSHILISQQDSQLKQHFIINWLRTVYRQIFLEGVSSNSGRWYFVTIAASKLFEAGGGLRDAQDLQVIVR